MEGIFRVIPTLENLFTDGIGITHRHGYATHGTWGKCHALLQNAFSSVASFTVRALVLCPLEKFRYSSSPLAVGDISGIYDLKRFPRSKRKIRELLGMNRGGRSKETMSY